MDLYYNDMWGLKTALGVIEEDSLHRREARRDPWNVVSNFDQIIYGLACVLSGNLYSNQEKDSAAMASEIFGSYFK